MQLYSADRRIGDRVETWKEPPVVILGCGESINSLSPEEKEFLNRCDVLIGLNKFMAFSDLAGIRPTHVFFPDSTSLPTDVWLQLTFDFCKHFQVEGVTFILGWQFRQFKSLRIGDVPVIVDRRLGGFRWNWRPYMAEGVRKLAALPRDRRLAGETAKLMSLAAEKAVGRRPLVDHKASELAVRLLVFAPPSSCKYEYVANIPWANRVEKDWATSLKEPLYYHRGSLTSVLNYASIVWPGREILLVGTDFNSNRYFFENSTRYEGHFVVGVRRAARKVDPQNADKHFSVVEHEGTTMFDAFPFITKKLGETGNRLYCANKKSLLVQYGCVPYREIVPT